MGLFSLLAFTEFFKILTQFTFSQNTFKPLPVRLYQLVLRISPVDVGKQKNNHLRIIHLSGCAIQNKNRQEVNVLPADFYVHLDIFIAL